MLNPWQEYLLPRIVVKSSSKEQIQSILTSNLELESLKHQRCLDPPSSREYSPKRIVQPVLARQAASNPAQ